MCTATLSTLLRLCVLNRQSLSAYVRALEYREPSRHHIILYSSRVALAGFVRFVSLVAFLRMIFFIFLFLYFQLDRPRCRCFVGVAGDREGRGEHTYRAVNRPREYPRYYEASRDEKIYNAKAVGKRGKGRGKGITRGSVSSPFDLL